jgi:predicted lipoprotein with Yx(FWY)xxD motif
VTLRRLAIACLAALALAACGEEDAGEPGAQPGGTEEQTGEETEPTGAEPTDDPTGEPTGDATDGFAAVVVEVGQTDLGDVLVDSAGMTLYLFDNDSGGESTCYDQCAATWPPLLGSGAEAGDGADQALLGVIERTDGSQQVTYAGHPLYYFAGDSGPGDVAGQAIQDIWWVVSPSGEALHEAEEARSGPTYDY